MTIAKLKLFAILVIVLTTSGCTSVKNQQDDTSNEETPAVAEFNFSGVTQYTTSRGNDLRFAEHDNFLIGTFPQPDEHFPTLILDPAKRFQTIEGFGGALTDAAAETFYKLPKQKQDELIKAYFDSDEGIGYSLCRTHIHSCDFSSESYAYSEVPGDKDLDYFSIEHDLNYKIPFIRRAIEETGGNLKLFASPWSPPAWMKTNNSMLQGGKLRAEYFQTWADYFVRFFETYREHDISFWGLTVQNEPMAEQRWESCIFTATEERDFVKNYLGPTLEKNGMGDKKIIIWDHNRGIMYQRAKVAFDDPEASKYIWGTGFHWYSGDHFENVKQLAEAFPEKKTLFTEGCVFPFDYTKINEWHWGERYGESLIKDLNNSTSGWVDWNILLDETGGPNHVANFCYAPVIGNTGTGELIYMSSYYYLGHFSKFIRPGAQRIICSSNNDELLATAFINPDNSIAVVAMNPTDNEINFKIWLEGKGTLASIPAHGISTLVIN
ncbi:glycoside hydrolase family 30 protein [Maribellus sediminis]|uniref:glycoside hydrolase family 30 protein n=1 Tax=Maribellus sediminis TaxID=2696285 RepID=UPI00143048E7|nr:glycoside hydrolase family 30 protein [Maribellus sediminis]